MWKTAVTTLFLCAISTVLPLTLAAQTNDEPSLYITCTESGEIDGTSYQTSGEAVLRLCTMGGKASTELYKLRRSVKGLKVGERLQFYISTMSGNGKDNDGNVADMVSIGDGLSKTTLKGPRGNYTFEDKPNQSPPSSYSDAEIVRTTNGAVLRLDGLYGPRTGGVGYFYGVSIVNADKKQRENLLTFQISEAELDQWDNLNKTESGGARGPGGQGSWKYSVTVTAKVPDLGEVAVEIEGYDKWIPEAVMDDETKSGNEIHVRAWVHKTGDPKTPSDQTATFTFELVEVSREPGLCGNWPTNPGQDNGKPDLRMVADKNKSLKEENPDLKMSTPQRVAKAECIISSFDYGAWGMLKVEAKDKDGNPLKVVYLQRRDFESISIPKDEDHNRIADAWQEEKGVAGLPADWDEAEVSGQDVKGDGLSLYQKYRGFVVASAGGKYHVRLEPREKVHFVIDPQGIFDEGRWLTSSGIRAYKVLAKWTKDRQVDINRGFGGGNGKWAVRIEEDSSKVDESAPEKDLKELRSQWAVSEGAGPKWIGTPKNVTVCRIYSGRISYTLRWIKARMLHCLKAPGNADDREEAAWLLSLGLSKDDLISRLKQMSGADLEALVKPLVAWSAIHECGHACGIAGHLNDKGDEDSGGGTYVPDCPMQYMTWQEKRKLVLFGEMGGQGKFCDADPQHCWKHLNPKD